MRKTLAHLVLLLLFVFAVSTTASAVGELIGLTVKITTKDGKSFEGLVVAESEITITLSSDDESLVVQRDQIESISLIKERDTPTTSSSPNTPVTLQDDPAFIEVRKLAMRKAAFSQIIKDGNTVAQAALSYLIAREQPDQDRYDLVTAKAVIGIGSWVIGLFTGPSLEERLYWNSQLPFWHGIVGLAGGVAGIGAGISLGLGYIQKTATLSQLDPADVWFDRAEALYLAQGGAALIHLIYDASVLAVP